MLSFTYFDFNKLYILFDKINSNDSTKLITRIWESTNTSLYQYNNILTTQNAVNSNYFFSFTNIFMNNILFFILVFGVIFFVLTYGVKLITTNTSNYDLYYVIFGYLNDTEEELGAIEDVLSYILVFALFIVWFFFLVVFAAYTVNSINWIFSLMFLIIIVAFLVPFFVLKNYGIAFVTYVRGSGKTTNLVFEGVLDLISVSIMFTRFLIQNMRFIFIFGAFFELYEFIYDKMYVDLSYLFLGQNYFTNFSLNNYTNWYWYELVSHLLLSFFLYIYYVGHLTLLFISQLTTYFALSFWLFFFLYTTFILHTHEKYFFLKD